MKNKLSFLIALFMVLSMALTAPVYAKKDGDPAGWSKGKKTGWDGKDLPPGLSKADAKKAEKEAKKKQKEAEKAAKKAADKIKEEAEKAAS